MEHAMEHTEHPALADALWPVVHKQRRLLAGSLRIVREEKEQREEIARLLEAAGVHQVNCNGFSVFVVERDGRRYAVVNPIK
jgi:hypothetical protein